MSSQFDLYILSYNNNNDNIIITILLLTGSFRLKAIVFVVLFGIFSPNIIHITILFLRRLHTKKGLYLISVYDIMQRLGRKLVYLPAFQYIYTQTHTTHTHTHTHIYIYIYIHVCVCVNNYVCIHTDAVRTQLVRTQYTPIRFCATLLVATFTNT